ncbi:MAG: (Fe-S)-binding protein [Pseudomonadota bacterium]
MTNEELPSFADKYHVFRCIQCGKCSGGCPMFRKSHFNVRKFIYDAFDKDMAKVVFEKAGIWDCTTCSACLMKCPKGVDTVELVVALRGLMVEDGRIPPPIRDALKSIAIHKNPWKISAEERSKWAEGLKVKNISEGADILYYVGCTPAYDARLQKVARAIVAILNKAGVDFGIPGNEEGCCGREIRRMGDVWTFEYLAQENIEILKKYNVKKVITTSPHCYNTFKNEYKGADFEVQHYTEFFASLLEEGRLSFSGEIDKIVTYHDPCFLGKQNKVFDPPRKVLKSIPGIRLVEMDRARERSLCCEGGGGRMWVESEDSEDRLAKIRVGEAMDVGAQIMATACPFCLLTLEDVVKTEGLEESLEVRDVAELVSTVI